MIRSSEPCLSAIEIAEQLIEADNEHHKQRAVERHGKMIVVTAVPLDDDFQPVHKLFKVVARDISTRGVGLIHSTPIVHQHLKMKIPMPGGGFADVVVQVVRCEPIGDFYEIGCRFVERI